MEGNDKGPQNEGRQSSASTPNDSPVEPNGKPPFFAYPDLIEVALTASQVGIWSWDVSSNKLSWSSNTEAIRQRPKRIFDGSFEKFEAHIHPEDRSAVLTALREGLRSDEPCRTLYRLANGGGEPELWIESVGRVVRKADQPVCMVGTCRNVTSRVKLHSELRTRISQQEAVARLSERALTESDLQKLCDDAVSTIASLLNVEYVKILELAPGDAELFLRAGVGFRPELVGTAYIPTDRNTHAGYALLSGRPVVTDDLATETRFSHAWLPDEARAVSGIATPIAARDGRAYGVLAAHAVRPRKFTEIDVLFVCAVANVIAGAIQRLQLDQRQHLMIRELRHRSGNLFSQLLALFSQTAKSSKNLAELVPKYEARVLALANAHRLITEGGWKSASLLEVLNTLLAPYLDRITFEGPNVFLEPDPTFGLSMAIHELASNAVKYGSLSTRFGQVEVSWKVDRTERGLTLILDWKERNGPPPKRQRRPGFGSRLIMMVIQRQLNGEIEQNFGPEGLDVRLILPLTHERWPGEVERPSDLTGI